MRHLTFIRHLNSGLRALLVMALIAGAPAARAADAGFAQFIASLWPEAQAAGVSRATFDAETRGLEPDYKLPDLILPGRPATGAPSQAEFVQVPADYIKENSIARLAEEGQRLMAKHRDALNAIEARFGVPATVVLAIWGRETDYGRYTLPACSGHSRFRGPRSPAPRSRARRSALRWRSRRRDASPSAAAPPPPAAQCCFP